MKDHKLSRYSLMILIPSLNYGGEERRVISFARYFKERFRKVVVCSCGGPKVREIAQIGIPHIKLPLNSSNPVVMTRSIWQLCKIIRKEDINLLQIHKRRILPIIFIVSRLCRVPCSFSAANIWPDKIYFKWFLPRHIIAISDEVKDALINRFGAAENWLTVVHLGIELPKAASPEKIRTTRKKFGIRDNEFVIGNVGRLTQQKGQKYLLQAFRIFIDKYRNSKLIIVGDGELRPNLEHLTRELGCYKNVIFAGYQEDMASMFGIMDIVVQSSLWEGFPNVLLEALAVGRPVIATSVGGTSQIIQHERTGILVQPRDYIALSNAMIELASNYESAKEMARVGRSLVERHFTIEEMCKKYEREYVKLLNPLGR